MRMRQTTIGYDFTCCLCGVAAATAAYYGLSQFVEETGPDLMTSLRVPIAFLPIAVCVGIGALLGLYIGRIIRRS